MASNRIVFIKDTACDKSQAIEAFQNAFVAKLEGKNLGSVQVVRVADAGIYNRGIVVKVLPENIVYTNVTDADIDSIIEQSVANGKKADKAEDQPTLQQRIVLKNCGVINPESLEEYIANDGYLALKKALFDNTAESTIEIIKESGLRGRGGGGFPTWMKWNFARKVESDQKYVICNADEGDPGAYMDRSILEGDPHAVVEGMILAGYCVGASQGFFYIRAEYPLAIARIRKAIDQAYKAGLLGKNIMGSDFSFDLDIRLGAGAFVCGEETALIASIEGKRGTPIPRPPYPSVKGLWGKPTCINNVETLANVPMVLQKGAQWFAGIGTEQSKGTKVFALTGKVKHSGLIEVPMGTTLNDILYNIGGGVLDEKDAKAIQTGGPSGGVIPTHLFDTPVAYETLQKLGSIMGSGGMIVMDTTDCMVDISKFYLKFCVDESCGKCSPCRIGGYQMLHILTKISEGKGKPSDIDKLKKICTAMQKASLCGLGQTAPNPVVSTIKHFEDEYLAHIDHKKCPASKCTNLLMYKIVEDACVKCGMCARNCPTGAITGSKADGYVINEEKCIKCGRCFDVCKFNAVTKS